MAKKDMFTHSYLFKGGYSIKVDKLCEVIDNDSKCRIFNSAVELFIFASLIGALNKRKSRLTGENTPTTQIMAEQFINHSDDLKLAFKFVILTSNTDNVDSVTRLNKAFRNPETDDNYTLFEQYMLGGIDELYENLIIDSNNRFEDYFTSVNELLDKIKKSDSGDEIIDDISTDDFDF